MCALLLRSFTGGQSVRHCARHLWKKLVAGRLEDEWLLHQHSPVGEAGDEDVNVRSGSEHVV